MDLQACSNAPADQPMLIYFDANEYREGVDLKNFAELHLLNAPSSFVHFAQLCGRVLRGRQNDPDVRVRICVWVALHPLTLTVDEWMLQRLLDERGVELNAQRRRARESICGALIAEQMGLSADALVPPGVAELRAAVLGRIPRDPLAGDSASLSALRALPWTALDPLGSPVERDGHLTTASTRVSSLPTAMHADELRLTMSQPTWEALCWVPCTDAGEDGYCGPAPNAAELVNAIATRRCALVDRARLIRPNFKVWTALYHRLLEPSGTRMLEMYIELTRAGVQGTMDPQLELDVGPANLQTMVQRVLGRLPLPTAMRGAGRGAGRGTERGTGRGTRRGAGRGAGRGQGVAPA